MAKQFHIINVGNSLLTNFQRSRVEFSKISQTDGNFWKEKLNDVNFINEIYQFLESNPMENSAEMNTFLRVVQGKEPREAEVYLSGTNTYSNEICVRTLQRFLKSKGYLVYEPPTFSGYFFEASRYDEKYAGNEFVRGVADMVDRFIYLAMKKKSEGYEVFINPTGGLKAHVIACALAGFLTGSKVYYMNEEFKDVVFLPEIFYLPKGKEVDLLEILSDKKPRSGPDYEKIVSEHKDEVERLQVYGLVEIERDEETNKPYRIRITNRGLFFLNTVKQ